MLHSLRLFADWLLRGSLPWDTAVTITTRVAAALDEAHHQGLTHCDLKPSNILLDQRGDAFLSDFGIVKRNEFLQELTSDALIGTPTYMSPEQIQTDQPLDRRSDVYSLGVVLFEMLTGRTPYPPDTPARVLMAHVPGPVPHVSFNQRQPVATSGPTVTIS